jgi:hypothetical protein
MQQLENDRKKKKKKEKKDKKKRHHKKKGNRKKHDSSSSSDSSYSSGAEESSDSNDEMEAAIVEKKTANETEGRDQETNTKGRGGDISSEKGTWKGKDCVLTLIGGRFDNTHFAHSPPSVQEDDAPRMTRTDLFNLTKPTAPAMISTTVLSRSCLFLGDGLCSHSYRKRQQRARPLRRDLFCALAVRV